MKRYISSLLCLLLVMAMGVTLVSCGSKTASEETEPEKIKVGIAFPNDSDTQWVEDGLVMKNLLTAAGYDVSFQYANNDSAIQISQVRQLISDGCTTLIIAAVDPSSIGEAFQSESEEEASDSSSSASASSSESTSSLTNMDGTPKQDGLNVIAYDRLITNCDVIDYYVGFDGYEAGYLQASYIEDALSLYDTDQTYNIELFFGDIDSAEAEFQYEGAMEILQVYLDSGVLQIPSGQTAFEQCSVTSGDDAADRMSSILSGYETGERLDAVFCADDSIAAAVENTVFSEYTGGVFPLITGSGCTQESIDLLNSGLQGMTLLKDCTGMAEEAAQDAITMLSGEVPESTDSLDNGIINVPSSLFYPEEVFRSNIQDMLVARGYYSDNGDGTFTRLTDYMAGGADTSSDSDTSDPEEIPQDASSESESEPEETEAAVSASENTEEAN